MILTLVACASGPRAMTPEPVIAPAPQPQPPPQVQPDGSTQVKRVSQDPIRLAILRLDGHASVGGRLGGQLCKQAHEDDAVQIVEGCATRELLDEQLMQNCAAANPPCLATIAKGLGATQILYGQVDAKGKVFEVTLRLVDAETQIAKSWTGTMQDADANLEAAAREGYAQLVGKVR
ncbi:MAG TPA: hypothetical protein VIU61_19075 [Kofleriaceae bacterium]